METAKMSMDSFNAGLRKGITKRETKLAKLALVKPRLMTARQTEKAAQLRAEIAVAKGRLAHARPDDGASVIVASA